MNGEEHMHFPDREDGGFKWNFNTLVVAGGIMASVVVNAVGVGIVYANLSNSAAANTASIVDVARQVESEKLARIERDKQTDANLKSINDKLPQFDIIAQQILRLTEIVGGQAKQTEGIVERFERFNNLYGDKLDAITSKLAEVQTDVKVVQSQLGNRPQRSAFTSLPDLRTK